MLNAGSGRKGRKRKTSGGKREQRGVEMSMNRGTKRNEEDE